MIITLIQVFFTPFLNEIEEIFSVWIAYISNELYDINEKCFMKAIINTEIKLKDSNLIKYFVRYISLLKDMLYYKDIYI